MSSSSLKSLLQEYSLKREKAIDEANNRKESLYKANSKLEEIDVALSKEAIRISKLLLASNDPSLLDDLNKKVDELKKQKTDILKSLNVSEDYFKPDFSCTVCNDTGYTTENGITRMCNCLKQRLFDIEFNKSNISNLKNENFENFDLHYYSDEADESKYKTKLSPRQNIEKIKDICMHFIDSFDDIDEKNLLFTGNTGLGKSFLSSCIANELLKNGKTVLYQTAPVMLDSIIDFRFGKSNSNSSAQNICDNILNVDLLIIDDLGTESMNSVKFAELFNIINSRLLNSGKVTKTIISTNLSLQNLFATYDERIVSRIVGNYNICYFFGDDIRFKKR